MQLTFSLEQEPLLEMMYPFKGFGIHPSKIRVKIWRRGNKYFVFMIDLGLGTSVTNAAEQLVQGLTEYCIKTFTKFPPTRADITFAEGYEGKNEGVDLVIPTWDCDRVISVDWQHLGTLTNLF